MVGPDDSHSSSIIVATKGKATKRKALSAREKLEHALNEAVRREDYEQAAKFRDSLRNLKTSPER